MTASDDLQHYLQQSRDAVLANIDGISEYDVRRPLTATGTNLLGIIKHLIGVERGYLADSVGRPAPIVLPWYEDGSVWDNGDMWAKADESREYLVDLYRTVWSHADESIASLPLDHPASVSWWPESRRQTTFGHLLVRTVTDTAQHAGQGDILREQLDGQAGRDRDEVGDDAHWRTYVDTVQRAADAFRLA